MRFRWGHLVTRYLWQTFRIERERETVLVRTRVQRLYPPRVCCVRCLARISRQRGSTTGTDACIARSAHQGRADALWATHVCSEGALRWSRASRCADNSKIIRWRNCNVRQGKEVWISKRGKIVRWLYYVLPKVPSPFRACHHFPFLSMISKTSPLENEISLGSSGDAVSMADLQDQTRTRDCSGTHTRTTPLPSTGMLCSRPR